MKVKYFLIAGTSGILLTVLLLGAIDLQASAAAADDPVQSAVSAALDYIKSLQDSATGGYGTGASTADSTLAVGSAGYTADEWRNGQNSATLMDYWYSNASAYSRVSAGEAGKLAMALVAANGCLPGNAARPESFYDPETGIYHQDSINQAFVILGLAAKNKDVPAKAVDYLKSKIQPDGGWKYGDLPFFTTDTNTTAVAVQALIAAGNSPAASEVISGMNFIKSSQALDGGFFYSEIYTTTSDTNSSAYAVQAIYAVGEDPAAGRWVVDSTNPISYLLEAQLPDGSFEWMKGEGSNLLATQQAVPALLGKPFPLSTGDLPYCPLFIPFVSRK